MMIVQPELQKLQKKYKGKNDRESREKFAKEQMDLYKRTGSNPLSSCLPILVQIPIFTGLFFTLNGAQAQKQGVGPMSSELAIQFSDATFLGAKLSETFLTATTIEVQIMAGVMVFLMSASQFITQRQIIAKNQNPAVQNSQYMQTQKILMYIFPLLFVVSGVTFPIAVITYWLTSNFWTMGQQFIVIRNMPTDGSPAYQARIDRLAKKGKLPKELQEKLDAEAAAKAAAEAEEKTQREQPKGKNRAKKDDKKKKK
jgi:YidC/Oxa1 family membrane protein insertase